MELKNLKVIFKKKLYKKKLNWAGPAPPRPTLFNFLNEIGMKIIFNKLGGVGMGVTRPESAPLPFLPQLG